MGGDRINFLLIFANFENFDAFFTDDDARFRRREYPRRRNYAGGEHFTGEGGLFQRTRIPKNKSRRPPAEEAKSIKNPNFTPPPKKNPHPTGQNSNTVFTKKTGGGHFAGGGGGFFFVGRGNEIRQGEPKPNVCPPLNLVSPAGGLPPPNLVRKSSG